MTANVLLTFNAGSSTIKIGIFETDIAHACRIGSAILDLRKVPAALHMTLGSASLDSTLKAEPSDIVSIMTEAFALLAQHFDVTQVMAVGHRVVHGGDHFAGAACIDDATIDAIEQLTVLAPLHQPHALRLIRAVRHLRPDLFQSASFDTAFHRTNPDIVRRFAIPRALHDQGIKRYGFHGLSYKYIAGELSERFASLAEGKVVVAHLGSGASLCALEACLSRDSTMGFSTLDGIPMATRCGALDPGVLLHLLGSVGRPLAEVHDMLYQRSGLLGLSGISADVRELLTSDRMEAQEAIQVFTLRVAGEFARLAATLGGLDAIVFTAGIGEHQPLIRAAVCERLNWLGIRLDLAANATNAQQISAASSQIDVLVIPTDEEQVIANEALALFTEQRHSGTLSLRNKAHLLSARGE